MEIRSIKDVDERTWREFKSLAVKNNLKMALLLKIMINEFGKQSDDFWNKILKSEKNLSDEEADDMFNILEESRNEIGFRE